jgi:PAS domain S-box-containing protein
MPDLGFDKLSLEVLKAIGKALSQMNLYSAAHPAVQAQLKEAHDILADLLVKTAKGQVDYVIDGENVVTNGDVVGLVADLPTSVAQIFARFKLQSLMFQRGVTEAELASLCELGALRPDTAESTNPGDFLLERGVSHIVLNESQYQRVDEKQEEEEHGGKEIVTDASVQDQAKALIEDAAPVPPEAEDLVSQINSQSLERTIAAFVASTVTDPDARVKVMQAVLQKLRGDIEKHVEEATTELNIEKTEFKNESTRTAAVIGNMADGVVTVNDRGEVLMMNPEAEDLFGAPMAESVGKDLPSLVKDEHMLTLSEEVGTPKDRDLEGKVDVSGEAGAKRTLRNSTVVVKNEAGKPVGVVSSLTDKTAQREFEKMEREFVAHVTHELRAPLTSIRAALEIMQDASASAGSPAVGESEKMMSSALRNADRLEQLINGILDFSKLESGEMTVFPKGVGSDRIVQESFESLKPWADRKGLRLMLDMQPDVPPVVADKSRTIQVIVNLLSNAIKFSPRGGRIILGARASKKLKGFVHFQVTDQGPGIPKDEQGKVFEKFKQIAAGERHVGGTGLGLSIAKALVHMQGGEMWLESEEGKGASFQFTLPEYEIPAEEAAQQGKGKGVQSDKNSGWWKDIFGKK